MMTEEQRQQTITQRSNQVAAEKEAEEARKPVIEKINEYQSEKHLHGYGAPPFWVYEAILEKIVKPLQAEIAALKENKK